MPTIFDTVFSTYGFPRLLADFGEAVTYLPLHGSARSINAVIVRDPHSFYDPAGNVILPVVAFRVYDSETTGISSKEIDTGGDAVKLFVRANDTVATRLSIIKLVRQNGGVITVAAR